MQTLRINNIPPKATDMMKMGHHKTERIANEWNYIVKALVNDQQIKPSTNVTYEFWLHDKGDFRLENYATSAKFIQNGLIHSGILPKDQFERIKLSTVKHGGVSKQPYIIVKLGEA